MIQNSLKFGGFEIKINELYQEKAVIQIWSSAKVLGQYFVENSSIIKGKNVLELGSGTGLCGIIALKLGAKHWTFTDLASKSIQELIRTNCEMNYVKEAAEILALDWRSPNYDSGLFQENKFEVIIASDCFYEKILYPDLLGLLEVLYYLNKSAEFLITYHERGLEDPILLGLEKHGFSAQELKKTDPSDENEEDQDVSIFKLVAFASCHSI